MIHLNIGTLYCPCIKQNCQRRIARGFKLKIISAEGYGYDVFFAPGLLALAVMAFMLLVLKLSCAEFFFIH